MSWEWNLIYVIGNCVYMGILMEKEKEWVRGNKIYIQREKTGFKIWVELERTTLEKESWKDTIYGPVLQTGLKSRERLSFICTGIYLACQSPNSYFLLAYFVLA